MSNSASTSDCPIDPGSSSAKTLPTPMELRNSLRPHGVKSSKVRIWELDSSESNKATAHKWWLLCGIKMWAFKFRQSPSPSLAPISEDLVKFQGNRHSKVSWTGESGLTFSLTSKLTHICGTCLCEFVQRVWKVQPQKISKQLEEKLLKMAFRHWSSSYLSAPMKVASKFTKTGLSDWTMP